MAILSRLNLSFYAGASTHTHTLPTTITPNTHRIALLVHLRPWSTVWKPIDKKACQVTQSEIARKMHVHMYFKHLSFLLLIIQLYLFPLYLIILFQGLPLRLTTYLFHDYAVNQIIATLIKFFWCLFVFFFLKSTI